MVERDGDFHGGVRGVAIAMAEEHDLVMIGEVVVGDGDERRGVAHIDESIFTRRERVVVDPHIARREHANRISIGAPALAIVNVNPMYDDIAHLFNRNARPVRDVDIRATPIECLVARYEELRLQCDGHALCKVDPESFLLDRAIA